ncbi:hypothetical protein [Spirosoma oryzicola]|uniref:hypothetical protein n=1 Tax=Spirosoma oryzicola TaxID=2898794 RepID=UPI001E46F9D8|nr:hypothetical protein [Spirosoma oryzicola]UHG90581.1 DUF11 domain-containing protein [Spirosoma oryzicola]
MPLFTCRQLLAGVLFLCLNSVHTTLSAQSTNPPSTTAIQRDAIQRDTLRELLEEEQKRIIDPGLGRVPYERLSAVQTQLAKQEPNAVTNGIPGVTWQERGPSNAGGRTRAFLFDPNDPARKKVWAGSIRGGLWFNSDITDANASWTPVSDDWSNLFVSALAADPSNPQVMYAGTGDGYDYQSGGGIWKTTNGGQSWTLLSNTIPGGSSLSSAFYYINRIVVNRSGHVFVATQYGLVKSTDGGNSWNYTLAPSKNIGAPGSSTDSYYDRVTDLEIGSDGTLYAAFYPTKLYKSTGDATWTDITPAGSPTGERTELALAPSTSGAGQVIYAVTRKYNATNYSQDILWFKKSTNAGSTWSDLTIPVYGTSPYINHFTEGNGYYSMSLGVSPTDPNIVYAGGMYWFRSTNGGTSWSRISYNYSYQHGFAFQSDQSGNYMAAVFSDGGVFLSTDWGNTAIAQSTTTSRNTGYRAGETNSVSMRNSPASAYLLNTTHPLGGNQITQADLAPGVTFFTSGSPFGITFIDEDEPSLQIHSYYNNFYAYVNSSWQYLFNASNTPAMASADYDSPANTLYSVDYNNSVYRIRRSAGIGSTVSTTYLPLTGVTNYPSFVKLSRDRTALFVGAYPGKLYRITGLDQSSPTLTAIDNNIFPQYSTISSIDVGTTPNELIVTLSNYGARSVWYTNDGGSTWISKDEVFHGLPDIPVRSVLFNPKNYKQVLLGTEVGIWSSSDITASNPNWSFSNAGLGNVRVNQLRYRAADGRVTAATNGRGIFTSDIFAIPYTVPTVALTDVSKAALCAGNTFTVSFSTSGPAFPSTNRFEVWLSDANGNFTNAQRIGTGTASPVSATLASGYSALPYGTNYRVKVIATNPDVESGQSDAIAIGNLSSAYVYDRRSEAGQNNTAGTICSGSRTTLRAFSLATNNTYTLGENYSWVLNNIPINNVSSATLSVQQAGIYTVIVKQAGCVITSSTYNLTTSTDIYTNVISASSNEPQCDDHPLKLQANYIGETAVYQWTRDGVDISGATSYTFNANQTGGYAHRITDNGCTASANSSYFKFGRSLYASAYLGFGYDSLFCASSPFSKVINAALPLTNDYSIQWYRNGVPLTDGDATKERYYAYQPGEYNFLLKQGSCQTYSNSVILSLTDQIVARIENNGIKSACIGSEIYLQAQPGNAGKFQWQKDGIDIQGAVNNYFQAGQSGNYTVRITMGLCSAISAPISLTIGNVIEPVISYSSPFGASCSGASISVNYYTSTNTYKYQWFRNGATLNGATNSYLFASQLGAYSIKVTSGDCSGTSKELYVDFSDGKTARPIISTPESKKQLCSNNSALLTSTYSGGNWQWKLNGAAIVGATNYQLYATSPGVYSVMSRVGSCQTESDPIDVKIGEPTTATLSGNALVSAGQAALLPVAFTGPAPWSFTLTNGQSVASTYQNPYLVPVTPGNTTTFQLASVANTCGTGSTAGQATVTVGSGSADVSLAMTASTRTPNVGDVVTYTLTAINAGPQDAVGVQLSSRLPAGLDFVSAITPGVTFANGIVSANVGTITADNTTSISFQAKPTQSGTFATAAQLSASQTPDPDSQPNSGTGDGQDDAVTVDVRTPNNGNAFTASANPDQATLPPVVSNQPQPDALTADLSLTMAADRVIVRPAQTETVTATLKVSNRGGATVPSAVILISIPNGSVNFANNPAFTQVDSQTYKVYVSQLTAGQSSTLTIRWQPTGAGALKAQIADASPSDPDSTPGNGYNNGEDDEASISVREY